MVCTEICQRFLNMSNVYVICTGILYVQVVDSWTPDLSIWDRQSPLSEMEYSVWQSTLLLSCKTAGMFASHNLPRASSSPWFIPWRHKARRTVVGSSVLPSVASQSDRCLFDGVRVILPDRRAWPALCLEYRPCKNNSRTRRWMNTGPASKTLDWHSANAGLWSLLPTDPLCLLEIWITESRSPCCRQPRTPCCRLHKLW